MCKFVTQIQALALKRLHLNLHSLESVHEYSQEQGKQEDVEESWSSKYCNMSPFLLLSEYKNRLVLVVTTSACLSLFSHPHFPRPLHFYIALHSLPSVHIHPMPRDLSACPSHLTPLLLTCVLFPQSPCQHQPLPDCHCCNMPSNPYLQLQPEPLNCICTFSAPFQLPVNSKSLLFGLATHLINACIFTLSINHILILLPGLSAFGLFCLTLMDSFI